MSQLIIFDKLKPIGKKYRTSLNEKYPPSEPCSCQICLSYCVRPGWWTLNEAKLAIDAGYGNRMMLEMSPDLSFGVLSPAFKGYEGGYALNIFSKQGCNFLKNNLCELYGTDFQPIECRFCHHDRKGEGTHCHIDLEKDWKTITGQKLIVRWSIVTGFNERLNNFNNR
jgi:hypothetical protein